jgi:hypothetical protein
MIVIALIGGLTLAPAAHADTSSAAKPAAYQTAANAITNVAAQAISFDADSSGPSGTRTFSNGQWSVTDFDTTCYACMSAPAVSDAILAEQDPSRLPTVIATFGNLIDNYQQPDGTFSATSADDGIGTAFVLEQLGVADIALQGDLPTATAQKWQASFLAGANYLINAGDLSYYANGNINLAYTLIMYMAWRISGQTQYLNYYNFEWQFVENPPSPRWSGYGLVITTPPPSGAAYDAGGAGYLTEQGSGAPGFDPEYSELQLDTASMLFVLSHDERALDLMNLLADQELPLCSSTFILDAMNGSRHSLYTPFMSSGPALLTRYGRHDFASALPPQTAQIESSYIQSQTYMNEDYYMGLDRWLAPLMLDNSNVTVVPPIGATVAYDSSSGASSGSASAPSSAPSSGSSSTKSAASPTTSAGNGASVGSATPVAVKTTTRGGSVSRPPVRSVSESSHRARRRRARAGRRVRKHAKTLSHHGSTAGSRHHRATPRHRV